MLVPYINYPEKIEKLYKEKVFHNPAYKYWVASSYFSNYLIDPNDRNEGNLDYAIVHDETEYIIGFISANVARPENYIISLRWMSFDIPSKYPITFIKETINFIKFVHNEFGIKKICFYGIPENPVTEIYEKLIKIYNVRKVGTNKNHVQLVDGQIYDMDRYELMF